LKIKEKEGKIKLMGIALPIYYGNGELPPPQPPPPPCPYLSGAYLPTSRIHVVRTENVTVRFKTAFY
jgi:hypothetical protein